MSSAGGHTQHRSRLVGLSNCRLLPPQLPLRSLFQIDQGADHVRLGDDADDLLILHNWQRADPPIEEQARQKLNAPVSHIGLARTIVLL